MTENKLNHATSPYLLQHQHNPVHWRAWGPEALAEAKELNKPILLSVGYAACHWCHVMAHESFEDPATAGVMNDLFINIKVDREERPDIDAIYMAALHSLGQQGGWPLTMFLDTDAKPFWGGTYFPKVSQFGRPPFVHVLMQVASVFHNEPEKVRKNAEAIISALSIRKTTAGDDTPALSDDFIRDLARRITAAVDPFRGGLKGAPKFPQWNILWLLWRSAIRFDDEKAKAAVLTTLTNICQGGIYDHLGGGFARYSVDDAWLVPHFEKMLYDNALLIDLLTEAWRETHNPLFAARVTETIGWVEREMIAEGGGFAASLDADSEGEEGKYYVWTAAEISDVLGADDAAFFASRYDVTSDGNWDGVTILNRLNSQALLSDADEHRLAALRLKLLDRRAARMRPGWDDKVLADWNGLMISAMTRAGVVFSRPDWVAMARTSFDFIANYMSDGDRLGHSSRAGRVSAAGIATDYANMIAAALRLHQATIEPRYLDLAERWASTLDCHHFDAETGAYATAADDTRDVIIRLSNALDDATPNANAVHLGNLFALAAITGKSDYQTRGERLIASCSGNCFENPTGHCGFLAASFDSAGVIQIVASGSDKARLMELISGCHAFSLPGAVEYVSQPDLQLQLGEAKILPAFLDGKMPSKVSIAAVYLCQGPTCGNPVMELNGLSGVVQTARRKVDHVFSSSFTSL